MLPLYLYDHSGITMSTSPFSCPWDSGKVGYIVASPEAIRKNFGVKRASKKMYKHAEHILKDEVRVYDYFLKGDVWMVSWGSVEENSEDCCGFYGSNLEDTGIAEEIPKEFLPLLKCAWDDRFK